jgi:hypothetical protein
MMGMAELQQVTFPLLLPLMLQVPPEGGGGLPPVGEAAATAASAIVARENFILQGKRSR